MAALGLQACAPKYYASNSQTVPLFTEEGQGAASIALNPDLNRAEVRAAYAVGPGLGLQLNSAMYFPRDDSAGDGGSGSLFEAGVGHYRPLPNNLVLELWGLAAYGGLENHFTFTGGDGGNLHASLVRVALQPGLGYKGRRFEAAVSSRLGVLQYFNIRGDLVSGGESQREYLRDHSLQVLLEPALTLRGGLDILKLEAQIGGSVNLTDRDFPQDDNWASLGLVYSFR
jgi:hypothetical protein